MEALEHWVVMISDLIWGGNWGDQRLFPMGPIAIILLGSGLYFMIRLGARPLRRLGPAIGEVWAGRKGNGDPNQITPWQALSTALSGQVGTGNLAGVATAITLGGPGAIFWMWITAFFGMALAYAESSLAIKYREKDEYGRINGGPMYYIKNGLGKKWVILSVLFCIGTIFSAMATGGMVQANSITQTVVRSAEASGFALPAWVVGIVIAALTFAVIIGGIKSIGSVAGKVVPIMAALYVGVAFIVLLMNAPQIPAALWLIISSAFGLQEAAGGATGYLVLAAMRAGIARGLFSNEAGQGSAPIAHAAAQTKNPSVQGEIAMIGVFIDTLVICTMTALVILTTTGTWTTETGEVTTHIWEAAGLQASAITNEAYSIAFPGGGIFVSVCLALFAFTTIIGWSYYAEQAITYLLGEWATHPIRILWVGVIFIGAIAQVQLVWMFGDLANASMAFPNLIAILALSSVVLAIHRKSGDPDTEDGDAIMLGSDGQPYQEGASAPAE
ncbi:MAG: sodium:alanine symporter family protein [Pseudomonadota bacterium]